jgi:signal transduction histidine kinase
VRRSSDFRLRLPRRTARLRLTLLYGGLFLLSGIVLVGSTYVLFERATALTAPQLPKVPHTPAIQPLPSRPRLPGALYLLAQAQHQVTQDQKRLNGLPLGASSARTRALPVSPLLVQEERQLTRDQHRLAQAARQVAQAVHQVAQAGSVQAAQRASDSHQLLVDSGVALAAVAVLAVLAGWLVAGRMLRPIRTITRAARRISSTSLHERLGLKGPDDELKELGDTLDELFARLEAAFEAQRRFVANASHELRTPLTRERALVQVALGDPSTPDVWRSTGRELLASNREQETLIDALLALASSERGLDRVEQTDLADVCNTVLPRPRPDADRLGLHIETAIRPAPLEGDPRLLERLIANLVDNGISHNVADGSVQISTDTADGMAVLTVINTGPAIAPDDVDRLFQPFQRLDPRRANHTNGHGLGLSIVRAIAAAHRAGIAAQARPGGGLSVTVSFPRPRSGGTRGASVEQSGRNRRRSAARATHT